MIFNKPDLNAPRFRPKRYNLLNVNFCNKIKEKNENCKDLTNNQIKEVIKTFNNNIWESVIEKRDGVELLEQLGYIFIGTCQKKKNDNPDNKKSIDYGVKVQHQNWESDQYTAKIFYTNYETKYKFKYHQYWGFKAVRDFKRKVSKEYPINWKKYVIVDNYVKISKIFRSSIKKDKLKIETDLLLNDYDEFDLN